MTTFSLSPRLIKGAIVGLDPFNPVASVVVFQYNPETVTRTLAPNADRGGGDADPGEALRLKGPPNETISLTVEVDATDQLEQGLAMAGKLGIYPALAALEMLLYPKSALVIANEVLSALGVIEVVPPEAPLTLFVWGTKRIVPVRLTNLSITEEAFDPDLNPILAKVQLTMRVLTYHDLGLRSVGGGLSMAQQVLKEAMATAHSIAGIVGTAPPSFSIGAGVRIGG